MRTEILSRTIGFDFSILLLSFFFGGVGEGREVGLRFGLSFMQAFYHLSHTSSAFCSGYFAVGVSLFAQAGCDFQISAFPKYLGVTVVSSRHPV
jgi:hypothetical protein